MTNEEIILNTLKQSREPMTAGQIAEHAGIDRKAVDKAMAQLKKHAKIVSPKRCYWIPA